MQYSFAALALAALASANPVAPSTPASSSCMTSEPGTFEIQVVNVTSSKRDLIARDDSTALKLTLKDGHLKDAKGRIGYIAANNQFQFDYMEQPGSHYDAGWAVCPNGTLVLGPIAVFQQCLSGSFYNLYDFNDAAQCSPVHIQVINVESGSSMPVESQQADGQPTGSAVAQQITDGQIQKPTGNPLMQISDGQIQKPTGSPVQQISDGQIQKPTGSPVQQISDGQIQKPTGSPVQQISDGQIQKPTGSPVQQISDGQIQKPTGSPVQQISDGQIQKPTGSPVQQISDGQIQKPTGSPVAQISDGQIQAQQTNSTSASPSIVPYTGAASAVRGELFGLFAGILAVALF